jgi:5-formyltetrahydrofolate cyclo-ligase
MTMQSNQELRNRGKKARNNIPEELHAKYSLHICHRFLNSGLFFRAKNIACYLSSENEVDTSLIFERAWKAKKRVYVPIIEKHRQMRFVQIKRNTRLERNHFGIWEPVSGTDISSTELDVVVTPLVTFDEKLNRIGMGGGYFDRYFSFLKSNQQWLKPKLVGFAFECQKVEQIGSNPWDIRLYRVITESN